MQKVKGAMILLAVTALLALLNINTDGFRQEISANGLGSLETRQAHSRQLTGNVPDGQERAGSAQKNSVPKEAQTPADSLEQDPAPDDDERLNEELGNLAEDRLNILLLGIDARDKEQSRSDSIILVSMNPSDYSAVAISVMRDTYVTIPAPKPVKNRINAAYALGGPELTVKCVSSFLQVPIHYYMVIDFQGFEKVIDAVGGVELEVEKKMDYVDDGRYDIHLRPGKQTLNGRQALGYARFRHDVLGDYARVERQRKLLTALLHKLQGIQAVYYLPRMVDAVRPYLTTNLDISGLASIAYFGYKLNDIRTCTVPSPAAHKAQTVAGMSVLVPNVERTRREVKDFLQGRDSVGSQTP